MKHYLAIALILFAATVPAAPDDNPLAAMVIEQIKQKQGDEPTPETVAGMLNRMMVGAYKKGEYALAEQVGRAALQWTGSRLGEGHAQRLTAINNLAASISSQGRYGEAEPLYLRVLAAREQSLGKEHPDTLASINNLAGLYQSQGRYAEAEPLYRRALEASDRTLGKEHPQTLASVNNLAGLYQSQGRYGEAEPLYLWALQATERSLGKEHPDTLLIQRNLVALLVKQGRSDAAIAQLRSIDAHLHGLVDLQLLSTLKERVRRGLLYRRSKFQDLVFSLALQHPGRDAQRLAADVLLRWKRVAGEAEALIFHLCPLRLLFDAVGRRFEQLLRLGSNELIRFACAWLY